jgi:hypothetical protein
VLWQSILAANARMNIKLFAKSLKKKLAHSRPTVFVFINPGRANYVHWHNKIFLKKTELYQYTNLQLLTLTFH